MTTPKLLLALCLTAVSAHADSAVVETAEVDVSAGGSHTFTLKTPSTHTLLKEVAVVNMAQRGECAVQLVSLVVQRDGGDVANVRLGFNGSEWSQFVGTNTTAVFTKVQVIVLNCAVRVKVVGVFYHVEETFVTVASDPLLISSSASMPVDVPLSHTFVSGATLRLLNLLNCANTSFDVRFGFGWGAENNETTFDSAGDSITVVDGQLHQVSQYPSGVSVTTWVYLDNLPSTCVANFVVELACHHVDIPLTVAPPSWAPPTPYTPWPESTETFSPLDLPSYDWGLFGVVFGGCMLVFSCLILASKSLKLLNKKNAVANGVPTGVVVQGLVDCEATENSPCETTSLTQ